MIDLSRSTEYESREEWLEARRLGIGGSDAPAILKQSPWASPWSVWAEKRGLLNSRRNDDQRLIIGQLMEPVIARLFELETGSQTECLGQFRIFTGDEPFQKATLDRVDENKTIVELKTEYYQHKWKDGPPLHYQIQGQHQMAVMGQDRMFFAVFFSGFQFAAFEIERNDRFIRSMTRAEAAFWEAVETDEAPEIDGSEATKSALQDWGSEKGTQIELPADELLTLDRLRQQAAQEVAAAETRMNEAENRIKALMGANEIALLNGKPAFSWKGDKRGTRRFLRLLKEGK